MSDTAVPPGFQPHTRRSPFTDPWQPLYVRVDGHDVALGTVLCEAHCNSRGLVHGGFIGALADNAMGLSVAEAIRADGQSATGLVTTNLSVDYSGQASVGDWLQTRSEVVQLGGTLAFARAVLVSGDRTVAQAHATFRVMRPKADKSP